MLHSRQEPPTPLIDRSKHASCFLPPAEQGLPEDAEEADLYKLFEPVPGMAAVRVVRDRHTQKCRGFAYLVGASARG
jgi:hypothetical protein